MRLWTYYEATKCIRVLVPVCIRECQITDYDSRRTADGLLDRGSTPLRSTKTEQVNLCICYYRIQEYVLFGVSKKIKVTTLYVTKVIYSVVIFMA